jgi:hypothetical protein
VEPPHPLRTWFHAARGTLASLRAPHPQGGAAEAGNERRRNTTAWERRKRGGLYYTRSLRRNGRIVRRYYGCGPRAELNEALDAEEAEDRLARAKERRREREAPEALGDAIRSLTEAIQRGVTATLETDGFHRHKGQWRKMRR